MTRAYSGIPTTYCGVRMRSRLEARWAAMFDEFGWVWDYEPMDLRGWIPDFLVHFELGDVLFEVKGPAEAIPVAKIEESGWADEVVLVGGRIEGPRIGEIVDLSPELPGYEWGGCRVFFCLSCGQHSLCNDDVSWRCRRCGVDGGHVGECDVGGMWTAAGNRVQWKAAG